MLVVGYVELDGDDEIETVIDKFTSIDEANDALDAAASAVTGYETALYFFLGDEVAEDEWVRLGVRDKGPTE